MRPTLVLCAVLLCSYPLFSQNPGASNWRFGNEIGIDFNTVPPTVVPSNLTVNNVTEPAVISNSVGQLVAYSSGAELFNGAGNTVENGTFTGQSTENLLVPAVGNPDLYYFFRSGEGIGVTQTLVDMGANGGEGTILEENKDIQIYDFACQLIVSSHENQEDIWVLMVSNNGGSGEIHITSLLISDSGVTEEQSFSDSFIFAGWYPTIDDARMSPDCQTIATSHKGHYVTLFQMDRATGQIVEQFNDALSLPDSFSESQLNYLEFSTEGDYLYVLADHSSIQRFTIGTFDPTEFENSGVELFNDATSPWTHIKRGPDENLYLYNENTQALDALANTDAPDILDVVLTSDTVEIGLDAEFMPNTITLCAPTFGIAVNDICIPEVAEFTSFGFDFADSTYWSIELDDGTIETYNEISLEIIYENEGEYSVEFYYLFEDEWFVIEDALSALFQPTVIDLGEDVFLCDGEEATFTIEDTPFDVAWSTGDSTLSVTVSEPGMVSVEVVNGFCAVGDEVLVSVQIAPESNLLDIDICETNAPLTLNAFSPNADTYEWNTGEDDSSIEVNQTGTYWVDLTNNCFTVRDSVDIGVFEQPELELGVGPTICNGDTASWNIGNEDFDIQWNDGSTEPTFETGEAGVVSVVVSNGPCVVSDQAEVAVIFAPIVDLQDIVICDDPTAIVLDATDVSADSYLWQDGSDESTLTVDESGTYSVELSNSCFSVSGSATVTYVFLPDNLLPDSALVCADDLVTLTVDETQGSLTWTTGETGNTIVNGTETVIGVQLNVQGCLTDDEIDIIRLPFPDVEQLIYPNVITLNGDELNEVWQPFEPNRNEDFFCDAGDINMRIQIFNRWGNKMFDGSCFWDGNKESNEKEVEKGTYYYIVDVTSRCLGQSKSDNRAGAFEVLE